MPDSLLPERRDLTTPTRPAPRRRSRIGAAALVSLGLHGLLLGSAWVLWTRHAVPVDLLSPASPPTVQLVMSPPGGKPIPAPTPREPAPPTPPAKPAEHAQKSDMAPTPATPAAKPDKTRPDAAKPNAAEAKTEQPQASPPLPHQVSTPDSVPPAAQPPTTKTAAKDEPKTAPAPATQPPPPAQAPPNHTLSVDLSQAESDTNAWVTGNSVLPPTADVKFHNRKPSYPMEAVARGEQGSVILLVHVAPSGMVTGVETLRSSGYPLLDDAAREAVLTWHFLPSVRDGQPVAGDMPARFDFSLD